MLSQIHEMELVLVFLCLLRFMQAVLGDCTVDSASETKYLKLLDPLKKET